MQNCRNFHELPGAFCLISHVGEEPETSEEGKNVDLEVKNIV